MHKAPPLSLVGHLQLEAHRHPPSVGGQFGIGPATVVSIPPRRFYVTVLMVGALLVLPSVLGLALSLVRSTLGVPDLYEVMFSSPLFRIAASASLFLGAPLAVFLNLLAISHLSVTRSPGSVATVVTFKLTLWHVVVLAVAFAVTTLFYGHLVADGLACWRGVQSAC